MELFSIPCSTCGARLKVKNLAAIGQIFNCPKCQSMVLVEAPPGWTPPAIEPPAPKTKQPSRRPTETPIEKGASRITAAAAEPVHGEVPEAKELPVATLEEPPSDDVAEPTAAAWQAPAEARWRRGIVLGAGITVFLGMLIGAWSLGRRQSTPDEALALDKPAEVEAASSTATPPAAIEEPPITAPEPPPAAEEKAPPPSQEEAAPPRRWLPTSPRLLLSLPLEKLADHETAPELLASGNSPLRETLANLRQSFHLAPEQIRRLTWIATDETSDLQHAIVVIELVQPLEDDAALLAGCQRLDLRLANAFCHQPPAGGWPHPFGVVDPRTLVTGPRAQLAAVGLSGEAAPSQWIGVWNQSGEADCVLALDVEHWPNWDKLQWPLPLDASALGKTWSAIKDGSAFAVVKLQLTEQPLVVLHLECKSPEAAEAAHRALSAMAISGVEDSQAKLEDSHVVWQGRWPGDARQLAANLIAALPTWQAPPPPAVAAASPAAAPPPMNDVASPAGVTANVPAAPNANETKFEQQVARRFEERIPAIVLRGMKLGEFAGFVSRMTGVTIALDDAALSAAGISSQTVIEVELTAATIGDIFSAALAAHELDFVAEENRLLITTRAKTGAKPGK